MVELRGPSSNACSRGWIIRRLSIFNFSASTQMSRHIRPRFSPPLVVGKGRCECVRTRYFIERLVGQRCDRYAVLVVAVIIVVGRFASGIVVLVLTLRWFAVVALDLLEQSKLLRRRMCKRWDLVLLHELFAEQIGQRIELNQEPITQQINLLRGQEARSPEYSPGWA